MSTRSTAATRRKEAETTAYGLLADKVAAVTALAEAGVEVDAAADRAADARQAHADAQERYADQYRAARAAGWSPADLTAAGCDQDRAGGALRARRSTRARGDRERGGATADASGPRPDRVLQDGAPEIAGPDDAASDAADDAPV